MKKLIILMFIPFWANAQIELSESYAFEKDKALHFGVGFVEGAVAFPLIYNKTGDEAFALRASWLGINFLSLSWEIRGMMMGKPMSLADIFYANVGWAFGAGLTHLVIKGVEKIKQNKMDKLLDVSFLPVLSDEPFIRKE